MLPVAVSVADRKPKNYSIPEAKKQSFKERIINSIKSCKKIRNDD